VVSLKILVLPGDGIGPEIIATAKQALEVLDAKLGLGLEIDTKPIGFDALKESGATWSSDIEDACRKADGVIMGPTDTAAYPSPEEGGIGPSAAARKNLDLFANIRPSRSAIGMPALKTGVDLVIVRENTEGFYADRSLFFGGGEFMPTSELAMSVRKITKSASERIAHIAFQMAALRRKKVTVVHKANVLKMTCGMFLEAAEHIGKQYPDIEIDDVHVDAMASDLVRKPESFDVVLCSNMYGDILSNLAAEVTGGLGLAGSLNRGDSISLAQAAHGSAPDIAGQGIANPTSILRSTAMMLRDLAERRSENTLFAAAANLDEALDVMLTDEKTRTPDLGGSLSTSEFGKVLSIRLDTQQ